MSALADIGETDHKGDPGVQGDAGPKGDPGAQGATGAKGDQGDPGPGSVGTAYTIPGTEGSATGGYLELNSANGHLALSATCNHGSAGDNETFFSANDPAVTTGTVGVTVAITGRPLLAFADLNYNSGDQDRGFADTEFQGTWPWHGVFIADEGGTLTRWDITMTGSPTGNCRAVVYATGAGTANIRHP